MDRVPKSSRSQSAAPEPEASAPPGTWVEMQVIKFLPPNY